MWSVWSERVDVYLGTGLVLVQRPGVPLWTFEPPATLPLADALRQVDQALDRDKAKPWRLRVHLSATLCPPVAFVVPAGVSRYTELMAIAQASAALAWAMPPERAAEVVCSLDRQHRGLAAALLGGTQQQIAHWAQGHSGRLTRLRPLWSAATQARACRESTTQNVAVLEPDALTVLYLKQPGAVRAMTWPGKHEVAEAMSRLTEVSVLAEGAEQRTGVALAFDQEPVQAVWPDGPAVWVSHWSELS